MPEPAEEGPLAGGLAHRQTTSKRPAPAGRATPKARPHPQKR
jgi:hypothetical protein